MTMNDSSKRIVRSYRMALETGEEKIVNLRVMIRTYNYTFGKNKKKNIIK